MLKDIQFGLCGNKITIENPNDMARNDIEIWSYIEQLENRINANNERARDDGSNRPVQARN